MHSLVLLLLAFWIAVPYFNSFHECWVGSLTCKKMDEGMFFVGNMVPASKMSLHGYCLYGLVNQFFFLIVISQKLQNLNLLYQRQKKFHQNVIQRRREKRRKRRLVRGPQLALNQGRGLGHVLHLILDQEGVTDHDQGRASVSLDGRGWEQNGFSSGVAI